jgi:hypothetical protein
MTSRNPPFQVEDVTTSSTLNNAETLGIFTWPDTDGTSGQVMSTDGQTNLFFQNPPASIGEVNTASNANTAGVGVYKQKTGVDLEFKGINPASSRITAVDTPATSTVDIDVVEAQIDHTSIANIGVNTHTQIDTHVSSSANPHTVTLEQARTGGSTLSGNISMGGNRIINLADPLTALQVANKQYVDSVASGLVLHHASVRATTTVNLVGTYAGTPAFTLTANPAAVLPAIDGVALNVTDRVLLKDQTDAKQNGAYTVTQTASPWILTRATDYDDNSEIDSGDFFFVVEGTVFQNAGFVLVTESPDLDVTDLVFSQFSGAQTITAGEGLVQVGNQFDVNDDNATLEIVGDVLRVKDAGITNAKLDKANIPISGFGAATAEVDIGGQNLKGLTLESDVATGTAPLTVASTTKVPNLYAAISGGIRTATNTVITDTGTAPVGAGYVLMTTSPTAAGWTVAEQSHGSCYMINNVTTTTVAVQGTYVKILGNTSAGYLLEFTHSNNRLTSADSHTHVYHVIITATINCSSNSRHISVALAKNGVVNANTAIDSFMRTNTRKYSVTCNALEQLTTNDYVEAFITDLDGTSTLTISSLNMTVAYM